MLSSMASQQSPSYGSLQENEEKKEEDLRKVATTMEALFRSDDGLSTMEKVDKLSQMVELARIINQFRRLDVDNTNSMDFSEFCSLAREIKTIRYLRKENLRELFDEIDDDSSGEITIDELRQFYPKLKYYQMNYTPCLAIPPEQRTQLQKLRFWLHQTLNVPESSLTASIFITCISFAIAFSILAYMLETVDSLKESEHGERFFWWSEFVVSMIFTLEYVTRFTVAVNRRSWIWETNNIIDFLAIIPFYIELITKALDLDFRVMFLRVLRVGRLARIFRIGSTTNLTEYLGILTSTMSLAAMPLMMLSFVLVSGMIVSATMVYTAESMEPATNQFDNIFIGMYWSAVTMSTLGYGDYYPETPFGQLIAMLTVYMGLVVLTFAINIVGESFDISYSRFMQKENIRHRERLRKELHGIGSEAIVALDIATEAEVQVLGVREAAKNRERQRTSPRKSPTPFQGSGSQPGVELPTISLNRALDRTGGPAGSSGDDHSTAGLSTVPHPPRPTPVPSPAPALHSPFQLMASRTADHVLLERRQVLAHRLSGVLADVFTASEARLSDLERVFLSAGYRGPEGGGSSKKFSPRTVK